MTTSREEPAFAIEPVEDATVVAFTRPELVLQAIAPLKGPNVFAVQLVLNGALESVSLPDVTVSPVLPVVPVEHDNLAFTETTVDATAAAVLNGGLNFSFPRAVHCTRPDALIGSGRATAEVTPTQQTEPMRTTANASRESEVARWVDFILPSSTLTSAVSR